MSAPSEALEKIMSEWSTDCIIDETDLGHGALNLAKLHSKYLNILVQNNIRKHRIEVKYAMLKQLKTDYYKGLLEPEELEKHGWEPFAQKLTNSGVEHKVLSDPELINMMLRKSELDEVTETCESILGQIKNMHFSIKSAIDWFRFTNGA